MSSPYMLLDQKGLTRLTRFERVNLLGMIRLQHLQTYKANMSFMEGEQLLMSGNCGLLLKRNYTDGTSQIFEIAKQGKLTPCEQN